MRQACSRQHANAAKDHGDHAACNQPHGAKQGRVTSFAREHQRPQPQDGVDAPLGHQRKQRTCRGGGCTVGGYQPEVQRPDGSLDQKGRSQHGGCRVQQPAVCIRHIGNGLCQVRHVQRAGNAVEHGHTNQEQRGSCQIDGDVVQTRLHALAARSMQQQPVGSCQHDFKEDEQVEQVGRQESTAQTHELQLEQRVEMYPRLVPACGRKQTGRQRNAVGQHQHEGGEPVYGQHNAKGRRPVAAQINAHGAGGARLVGPQQQGNGDKQAKRGSAHVHHHLDGQALFAQQQHQRCSQHGQQDGAKHEVWHQRCQPLQDQAHGISCTSRDFTPSTWSVPDMPREASSTTRNSAVMAKPITIAVSTRACGMGSA